MNVFQAFNNGLGVAFLAALVTGLARSPDSLRERPASMWLLLAFLFLFRFKMFLDDHKYFQSARTKSPQFKVGVVVAAVAWALWAFAALSISVPQDAYFLAMMALLVSTAWIAVVAFRAGAYREQWVWIGTNVAYVLVLGALYKRNGPVGDGLTWALLGTLLVVLAFDWIRSGSVPELEQ